ncbi:protein of unknown function [Azospirillum sp. RU38E]|nr:protein of unknown function [Azospirillum sp. RU38E]SNT28386.1 protein of unknown function [Azospirillum sp. RU37A]
MAEGMTSAQRQEHLFKVISSQRFLHKQGLGNEVPFFICPFPASEGLAADDMREGLIRRLANKGIRILDINLYDLSLDILRERDIFDDVLAVEADTDKAELRELLQGVLDPKTHIIPRIAQAINATPHDVIFLSGVGEVYPYIRSHNVLNNLQSTAKDKPTVMFFPGRYTHALATGASLDLFGRLHDDKYYRAFNILNYEV